MIFKPPSADQLPTDDRQRAGVLAERQMAHYLHRAFATSADLYVINDLRLVDPEQPETSLVASPAGQGEMQSSPGVAQIDHLVLHRYGAFIVEREGVTDPLFMGGGRSGRRRCSGLS